jgi:hypothetical protein
VVTFSPAADIAVNSTTVNSSTQITANVTIGAGAATGARDVTVSNAAPGGGTTGTQTFSINAPAAPTLSAIAPAAGDRLEILNVVFTGTNFVNGVTSVNVPAGFTVNSTTVDSPTQLTANITVDAAAILGGNSFSVTNTPAGGLSGAQTFTVSNPVPTITGVVPGTVTVGLTGTTVPLTVISGSGFISGVTVVDFLEGDVTIGGAVTVNSPNQITVANISYPGTLLLPISRTLRVTNDVAVTRTITLNP